MLAFEEVLLLVIPKMATTATVPTTASEASDFIEVFIFNVFVCFTKFEI